MECPFKPKAGVAWEYIPDCVRFECFYCKYNPGCPTGGYAYQQLYIQLMKEGKERDKETLNQLPEYWKYVFAGQIKHHLLPDIPYLDIDGIEEPNEIDEIIERAKENLRQNGFDVSNY